MSIRQAYTKYPEDNYAMENVEAENLVFSLFYRKLGNKYAVVMSDTQAIDSTGIIGGYKFEIFSSSFRVFINGNFYKLKYAYENDLISDEELAVLYEKHSNFVNG